MDYANMTPVQRMQAEMMSQLGITEDQFKAMSPADQAKVMDKIRDMIKQQTPEQRRPARRADQRHVGLSAARIETGALIQAMRCFTYSRLQANRPSSATVNVVLIGAPYAGQLKLLTARGSPMDAQRIAVDALVALTDCDREQVTAFIRSLYLAGVKDPKRLTFKGLQALART
jgi:hypothetical protein